MRAEAGLALLCAGLLYGWWPPAAPERAWWLLAWVLFASVALWLTRPRAARTPTERAGTTAAAEVSLGAELAHDFRTPLTRLRLRLGGLADGTPAAGGELAAMEAELLQLERLADDFIDLTSAEAAWPESSEGALDLTAAVAEEVERVRPLFDLQGRGLEVRLAPTKPVLCSPSRLARMLGNLFSNALRYAEGDGPVTVRLAMDGPLFVRLSIENPADRPEMDPTSLARPFVRGGSREKGQGFGLGLAVVQRLAAVSGGRMRLSYREEERRFAAALLFPRLASGNATADDEPVRA